MNKKILSVVIFFILCLCFLFVYVDDKFREKRSDTLHVVTTSNEMNYFQTDTMTGGVNYQLVKAIADSLNMNLEIYVENDYDSRVRGLRKGKYDLMLSLLPITSESKNDFLFTKPIVIGRLVLVQNKDRDSVFVDDFNQLNFKTIFVESHTYSDLVLENLKEELGLTFVVEHIADADYDSICSLVSSGIIDYAVMDNHTAGIAQKKYDNLDIKFNMGFNQFFGWPMEHRNTKLNSQLNNFIRTSFSLSQTDL